MEPANKKKKSSTVIDSAGPLGVGTAVLAILLPIVYFSLLPFAVAISIANVLSVVIPLAIFIGGCTYLIGRIPVRTTFIDGLTVISVLSSFLLCLLLILLLVRGLWFSGIGPSAEIVLEDDFSGVVEIRVLSQITPSLATAARTYRYEVPSSGYLLVKKGWINTTQHFEGGRSYPGKFFTHVRRQNGSPLKEGAFKCGRLFAGGVRCEVD